jgi:hypothetical protein
MKIKYKKDEKGQLITQCPNNFGYKDTMVNSVFCYRCRFYK